jgi:DNA replication protein DnaC
VGKSHLAIALGVLTAELGHRIYFTTAIELAHAFRVKSVQLFETLH